MDVLPCKFKYHMCVCVCVCMFVCLHNRFAMSWVDGSCLFSFLFTFFSSRMTMAAWVSNDLIPGALPVWHP